MHEMVFSKEIIRVVKDRLKDLNTNSKIICVNVRLSPLSHVRPDTLRSAFLQIATTENLGDIALNIKSSEVKLECRFCGRKFSVRRPLFICPNCKNKDFNIKEDKEFLVESIEFKRKEETMDKKLT